LWKNSIIGLNPSNRPHVLVERPVLPILMALPLLVVPLPLTFPLSLLALLLGVIVTPLVVTNPLIMET
jgi:hypothetical protein